MRAAFGGPSLHVLLPLVTVVVLGRGKNSPKEAFLLEGTWVQMSLGSPLRTEADVCGLALTSNRFLSDCVTHGRDTATSLLVPHQPRPRSRTHRGGLFSGQLGAPGSDPGSGVASRLALGALPSAAREARAVDAARDLGQAPGPKSLSVSLSCSWLPPFRANPCARLPMSREGRSPLCPHLRPDAVLAALERVTYTSGILSGIARGTSRRSRLSWE